MKRRYRLPGRRHFLLLRKGLKYLEREGLRVTLQRTLTYLRMRSARELYHDYFITHIVEGLNAKRLQEEVHSFSYKPKISIVMPVYNVPAQWLAEAVRSVQSQIYPNWELCIYDDRSTDLQTIQYLEQLSRVGDERVKVAFGARNLGISLATNQAISHATGDFVAFMDNDDVITVDALFEVVRYLQQSPCDFIYSDEDKMTMEGRFTDPYYKPDWSPNLILSGNYTSHFSVYRKSIGDGLGWLREGYEGSQDYDLVLRFTEVARSICHIPKVLYHWRMIPGSTAVNPYAKPYAYVSGQRALIDAAQRRGLSVKVTTVSPGHYRFQRGISTLPHVTVIVRRAYLENLRKLYAVLSRSVHSVSHNVVGLVANFDGREDSTNLVKICPYDEGTEAVALDQEIRGAEGEVVLLLSSAIEQLSEATLLALLEHGTRDMVGGVTGRVDYKGNVVHAGLVLGVGKLYDATHRGDSIYTFGYFGNLRDIRDCGALSADCLMVRKDVYQRIGGFDISNLRSGMFDIDYSLRARALGYQLVYTPYAQFEMTRPPDEVIVDATVGFLKQRWGSKIGTDPFYNPNLDRTAANYVPFNGT